MEFRARCYSSVLYDYIMKRLATSLAMLTLMAVPTFWMYILLLNIKVWPFKLTHILASSAFAIIFSIWYWFSGIRMHLVYPLYSLPNDRCNWRETASWLSRGTETSCYSRYSLSYECIRRSSCSIALTLRNFTSLTMIITTHLYAAQTSQRSDESILAEMQLSWYKVESSEQ